jgi:hypothetical protein
MPGRTFEDKNRSIWVLDSSRKMETHIIAFINVEDAKVEKLAKQEGVEFYTLPEDDQEKMWNSLEPIWDLYVENCTKQGLEKEAKQLRDIVSERWNVQ